LLSYEVLTAFFLEGTFLGVMLFGWRRVKPHWHCFATCMVALGTLISTFWIISANSWMHTPQGYEIVDGVFEPRDWWAIIFNPSFPYRLTHMTLAAFITTCWVIGGVSARYLWRRRHEEGALVMWKLAIAFAAITVPLQIVVGDLHGLEVRDYQPTKLAAIEANWDTQRRAPLILFALPDETAEKNHYEVAIPNLGSLILTHELNGEVRGLKAVPRSERPPVAPVFFAFRVMVGIGFAMLGVVLWSLLEWRRGRLGTSRALLWAWQLLAPAGFIAVLAGWYVTEIGRQPYVIYGVMRSAEAASSLDAGTVLASLIVFATVYTFVFAAGSVYLLKLLRKGPQPVATEMQLTEERPGRPLSAAHEALDAQ
jgi:cytochrome d ubiquinol oxidase subunit I